MKRKETFGGKNSILVSVLLNIGIFLFFISSANASRSVCVEGSLYIFSQDDATGFPRPNPPLN